VNAFTITVLDAGGQPMPADWQLQALDIQREVQSIPRAELWVGDSSGPNDGFAPLAKPFFEPGKQVTIKLRYEGETDQTAFVGLVTRVTLEARSTGTLMRVVLKDAAINLTRPRRTVLYTDKSDQEVIGTIISNAGLTRGTLTATTPSYPQLVQYEASDWDFMAARAEACGLVLAVTDGAVSMVGLQPGSGARHEVEFDLSPIFEFDMELDADAQLTSVEVSGWEPNEGKTSPPTQAEEPVSTQGNVAGASVGRSLGFAPAKSVTPARVDPQELRTWSNAKLARDRASLVRGRITLAGQVSYALLDVLALTGFGARFDGDALITGVRHRIDDSGWQTDLQFGVSPTWHMERYPVATLGAEELLPPVRGLQIGVVQEIAQDPLSLFRVKVLLPAVQTDSGSPAIVWARWASPDAGNNRGFCFPPEVGDEVVIGFLADDPRHPVVLGELYSQKNSPPSSLTGAFVDAANNNKGIVTRSGTRLHFIDSSPASLQIVTPNNNRIVISDQDQSIVIQDQNNNSIELSPSGITIKSGTALNLQATGAVQIKGAEVNVD
jgi:Rhs element Vgr protein